MYFSPLLFYLSVYLSLSLTLQTKGTSSKTEMLIDCQLWLTAFLIQVRSVTYHVNLFLQVMVIIPSVNWRPLTLPCFIWFNFASFNLRFFGTDCLLEISLLYHCHVSFEFNAKISSYNLLFLLFNHFHFLNLYEIYLFYIQYMDRSY